MVFSDVCYVNSLLRRRRENGLGFRNLYILPPIFETQFDCCLRSGDRTPIGHDSDNHKKGNKTNDSSVIVHRIKRSKSSDKSTKYSDSSKMNRMEERFYEKLSDIKSEDQTTNKSENNIEKETSVPLEEEIKSLNSSTKSSFFPSLPDVILRKLQLLRESCCSLESLSEQEVESKYATLSLSFKTDKLTLDQRVSLHKHQRDVAEMDANNELQTLRHYIQNLNQLILSCDDFILTHMGSEIKELLHRIDSQVDVIGQTNAKISSRSELFGAVKQEERVSSAFDVVLLHSENLKRAKDLEHKELEKTKKLLTSNGHKKTDLESDSDNDSVPLRRSIRSISTTVIPKMSLIRVRRASVSSIEILPNTEMHRKSVQHNISTKHITTSPSYLLNRSRRCSMPVTPAMYRSKLSDLESSHLEITTEEKCGYESDSSVVNQDSDEEHTSQSRLHLRLSDEVDISSNSSEPNNNTANALNNNNNCDVIETISHRFSHENSDRSGGSADNSSDENIKNNERNDRNNEEKRRKFDINFIEFNYFVNLFYFCTEGRVGSYVRRLAQEMRLILAIILLVLAVVIVVRSLLPTSFPCECHCSYSWSDLFHKFSNLHNSKMSLSPTH